MKAGVSAEPAQKGVMHRIMWVVLVVLIPLLVGGGMVLGALQFLGVPVLQRAQHLFHHTTVSTANQVTQAATDAKLQSQIALLQNQNQKLTTQVQTDNQQLTQLEQTNSQLQQQLNTKLSEKAKAEEEAAVLKGMDPSAAAPVLAGLNAQVAAEVIAVMAPADSGAILGAMSPTEAAKLLTLAGQVNFPPDSATNNTVGNSTQGALNNTAG